MVLAEHWTKQELSEQMPSVTQPAKRAGGSRMSYADRARSQDERAGSSKMDPVSVTPLSVDTDVNDDNTLQQQSTKTPNSDPMRSPSIENRALGQSPAMVDSERSSKGKLPTVEYVWTPFDKTMLISKVVHEQDADNEGFVFGHRSTAMRKVRTDTEEMVTTSVTTFTILDVVPVKHKGMSLFTFYDKAYNVCLVPRLAQAIQEKCDEDEVVVGWYQMVRNGPISTKRMAPKVTKGLRRTALFPDFAPFFLAIRHRDDNPSCIVDTETQLFELNEKTGELTAMPVNMLLAPTVSELEEQFAGNLNQPSSSVETTFFDDQFNGAAIVEGVERYWDRVMSSLNADESSAEDQGEEMGKRRKNEHAIVDNEGRGRLAERKHDPRSRSAAVAESETHDAAGGAAPMDYGAESIASSLAKSAKKLKHDPGTDHSTDISYIGVPFPQPTVSTDAESAPPGLPTAKLGTSSGHTSPTRSGPTTRSRRGGRGGGSKKQG